MEKPFRSEPIETDPIAIVGIGCRFPGGVIDPSSFWNLLCNEGNGISDIPPDRWDSLRFFHKKPVDGGRIYTTRGGVLSDIDTFDASFFGISGREAAFMDPQQRILLETTWEAFEDAGIIPATCAGTSTGVYIGSFIHDYENIHSQPSEQTRYGAYSAVGVSTSIMANRISHWFDFKGPSLVIDTACSSSMVAVHLACSDLSAGKADMAVAGGVNLILKPEMSMILCHASMLSPDGLCKVFDQSANGYVRSEGAGILVLKRLSRAISDNNPIYCLIKGTAVNQDGSTTTLTTPDGSAQVELMRQVLESTHHRPAEIQYVEAHGTGTEVGDPIEAQAIGRVMSSDRQSDDPCWVGSVKSNIGHTESAAGVAGLIKTALMLYHGKIPANLHFSQPNPAIDFSALNIRVPTGLENWQVTGNRKRRAGVNSFGFGGTNAHAILEEYDGVPGYIAGMTDSHTPESRDCWLIPLSADSEASLLGGVDRLLEMLQLPGNERGIDMRDLACSVALHRTHHRIRQSVIARNEVECKERLSHIRRQRAQKTSDQSNRRPEKPDSIVFVFSGMGQQWPAMARQLYYAEAVAREQLDLCDGIFRELDPNGSLLEHVTSDTGSRIHQTHIAQPSIFALQVALARIWIDWGVHPAYLVGHSVGEIAASHISGALSIEDACLLVHHRSRLQHRLAGEGTMLAVSLSETAYKKRFAVESSAVSIGAINSAGSITLAGGVEELKSLSDLFNREGIFNRFLPVEVPYHSPFMNSILSEFRESVDAIRPKQNQIPFISTVTGGRLEGKELTPDYWTHNIRKPVLFQEAIAFLPIEEQTLRILEIGAHPVLSIPLSECLTAGGQSHAIHASLNRKKGCFEALYETAGDLYQSGLDIDWKRLYQSSPYRPLRLPTYHWQRERYWNESKASRDNRIGEVARYAPGERIDGPFPVWKQVIDPKRERDLMDHRIENRVIFPLAGYLFSALQGVSQLQRSNSISLKNAVVHSPLHLTEKQPFQLHASLTEAQRFIVHGKKKQESASEWRRLFSTDLESFEPQLSTKGKFPFEAESRFCTEWASAEIYQRLAQLGFQYGPAFQTLDRVWLSGNTAMGAIREQQDTDALPSQSPVMFQLDACFQLCALIPAKAQYLPRSIRKMTVARNDLSIRWVTAEMVSIDREQAVFNLDLFDDDRIPIAEIETFSCQRVLDSPFRFDDNISSLLYKQVWVPEEASPLLAEPSPLCAYLSNADVAGIDKYAIDRARQTGRETYYASISPKLDRLAEAYWIKTLQEMINPNQPGYPESWQLIEAGMKSPGTPGLLPHVLRILDQKGLIDVQEETGQLEVTADDCQDPESLFRSLIEKHPEGHIEAMLVQLTGSHLAEILKGEKDPVDLLFAEHTMLLEQFYASSASLYYFNRLLVQILKRLLENQPGNHTLHILEIGAGTGGLTTHVLPLLDRQLVNYTITDISQGFVQKAKRDYKSKRFLTFDILDIQLPPADQGFIPHRYDIVLASSVFHATEDLARSLAHVRTLLKPQGMVIFNEVVQAPFWADTVFGVFRDWWGFKDFRQVASHPLIGTEEWTALLKKVGLSDIHCFKDPCKTSSNAIFTAKAIDQVCHTSPVPGPEAIQTPLRRQQTVIVISLENEFANRLQLPLQHRINHCYFHNLGSEPEGGSIGSTLSGILTSLQVGSDHIVSLVLVWENPKNADSSDGSYLWQNGLSLCNSYLEAAKTIGQQQWPFEAELWCVTFDTQLFSSGRTPNILQAPLWGARRVIANEYPHIRTIAVDMNSSYSDADLLAFCNDLERQDTVDEIAYFSGKRFVNRLLPVTTERFQTLSSENYRLLPPIRPSSQSFKWIESSRSHPADNEVEICVEAVGLNFKDVAKVFRLYDRDSTDPHLESYGMECAGIVKRVGLAVDAFKEGDRVYGTGWNCLARYTCLDARFIHHLPDHLSPAQAVTIPIALQTAYYGLHFLARMKKGDRVLIHSASGAVGLAAIQLCRLAGARVYTTAGSTTRRRFLQQVGVDYAGDSRSLQFAADIKSLTRGEGLDIILNTLPGSALLENVELLKPNTGQLIDIGNLHNESTLPVKALREGKTLRMFDLEKLAYHQPDEYASLFKRIAEWVETGTIRHLPFQQVAETSIGTAFRNHATAKLIGKTVITFEESNPDIVPNQEEVSVSPHHTYLIAGGTGGFGFATARWLVTCGARHIVLLSRTGSLRQDDHDELDILTRQGATLIPYSVDITDADALYRFAQQLKQAHPPVRGIVHSAMKLDVALVKDVTPDRISGVLAPKLLGAWNLYQCFTETELDFFLLYSSINSTLGFSGQYAYAAANSFLDVFSAYLRSLGVPASTICWSLIDEAGYFQDHLQEKQRFKNEGFHAISLKQAWKSIVFALKTSTACLGVFPVEWNVARKYTPIIRQSARFANLLQGLPETGGDASESEPIDRIASLPADKRVERIEELLKSGLADILGIEPNTLKPQTPFEAFSFDSLMAVEMGVKLHELFSVDIPKVALLEGGMTVSRLAALIDTRLAPSKSEQSVESRPNHGELPAEAPVDLHREAILPDDIVIDSAPALVAEPPKRVLLTGATGFLGAYLLRELLQQTEATVVCLVRADNEVDALQRIVLNLERYTIWQETYRSRIVTVVGDISRPRFGLDQQQWDKLTTTIDTVYHSAAQLNFALPYSRLKAVNVTGTTEVIRLAAEGKTIPLHHVSTLIKLAQICADPNRLAARNKTLSSGIVYDDAYLKKNGFNIGYHQSKWVAEELVLEAENAGLPAVVYRTSLIAGDSRTGGWNTEDYICRLVQGIAALGKAPQQDLDFDFCPVDYLAKAIVHLSLDLNSIGKGFILKNPEPVSWHTFLSALKQAGLDLSVLPPRDWLSHLGHSVRSKRDHPLFPLIPLFELRPTDRLIVGTPTHIKSLEMIAEKTTRSVLKKAGIVCPAPDRMLIQKYIGFFKSHLFPFKG